MDVLSPGFEFRARGTHQDRGTDLGPAPTSVARWFARRRAGRGAQRDSGAQWRPGCDAARIGTRTGTLVHRGDLEALGGRSTAEGICLDFVWRQADRRVTAW